MKPPTTRRRYQHGQILDDRDRWMCRFRQDVIENGQLVRKRRYEFLAYKKDCPTKRQAQKMLDDLLRAEGVNESEVRPRTVGTFKEFAEKWMEKVMVHDAPSTQRLRKSLFKTHLIPNFGEFQFKDITTEVLQEWVTANRESPSIRGRVGLMTTVWKTAQDWGYAHHDPFKGLKLPEAPDPNTYFYSPEEVVAIIREGYLVGREWGLLFRVIGEAGVRPGECAGLQVTDVAPRSLRVTQSVWKQKVKRTKTKKSVRHFAISADLGNELAEFIRENGRTGLVFESSTGRPLNMDYVNREILSPILEKLGIRAKTEAMGIERVGIYAFRHANMTILHSQGVPLKTIQRRVGHTEGSNVTMGHYVHAVDADDRRAADLLGQLLNPKAEGTVQ